MNYLLNGGSEELSLQVGTKADQDVNAITFDPTTLDATKSTLGIDSLTIKTKEDAIGGIDVIDNALAVVSKSRALLGSYQARLQSTSNNLEIQQGNLAEANSRIRDTDIASETAEVAKLNILSSAGTSVLGQANTSPSDALRLIG